MVGFPLCELQLQRSENDPGILFFSASFPGSILNIKGLRLCLNRVDVKTRSMLVFQSQCFIKISHPPVRAFRFFSIDILYLHIIRYSKTQKLLDMLFSKKINKKHLKTENLNFFVAWKLSPWRPVTKVLEGMCLNPKSAETLLRMCSMPQRGKAPPSFIPGAPWINTDRKWVWDEWDEGSDTVQVNYCK